MKLGLIGAGRIGKLHGEIVTFNIPGVEIKAVADIYTDQAKEWVDHLGIADLTSDYRNILKDSEIEAVLVCSSTDTHAQMIIEAAEASKHIFCEKPIALDLAAIDKALSVVEKTGVKLQIGFNRRFDPGFKHAKDMVSAGKIGTPHLLRITSRDPKLPPVDYIKSSGGLFMDMTIHDFDMSRFILGEEISEVFAVGSALVDPAIKAAGDIDTAVITLTYSSGAFGVIDNSRQAVYGYDQRIEIFGSKGCVMVGNRYPYDSVVYTQEAVTGPLPLYFFLERYNESFREEMRQFILSIQKDTEPVVTGRESRIPVVMALAAQRSLQMHKPVRIDHG